METSKRDSSLAEGLARRRFWADNLDRSYDLLEEMARHPVEECYEGFVSIKEAALSTGIEMHFSTTKLAGVFDRIYFVREGIIEDLLSIGREMNRRGWILSIEEGFRTQEMQIALGQSSKVLDQVVEMCRWESGDSEPAIELVAKRVKCLVANTPCTGTHMCGAAVDISVYRRNDGSEISRGVPYLHMSEKTPMITPFISDLEQRCRLEITEIMESNNFFHYPGEFWHYNNGDALSQILAKTQRPGRYGPVHWDADSNTVVPYEDYLSPLTSQTTLSELLTRSSKL